VEKLSRNIATDKHCTHCTVKTYSNVAAVFTWLGLEPIELENLFAYLFVVSFMHVTCDVQIKSLAYGGVIW
jgi:hypothetical protein